jgi:hypothetical protein
MVLHIMVSQNTKKSNTKETTPFFHMMWCQNVFVKSNVHHNVEKNTNVLKKIDWNGF